MAAGPIPVADTAVGMAALIALLDGMPGAEFDPDTVAAYILAAAKVRFQPSTRRLVLTFDLEMSTED